MNRISWTIITVIVVMTVFVIPFLTTDLATGQGQNATSQNRNDTRMILNIKDKTVTVVNTTTNETISIRNLTEDTRNMTANETLSGTAENMTANEALTTNLENATTSVNLTEKFNTLQGK